MGGSLNHFKNCWVILTNRDSSHFQKNVRDNNTSVFCIRTFSSNLMGLKKLALEFIRLKTKT